MAGSEGVPRGFRANTSISSDDSVYVSGTLTSLSSNFRGFFTVAGIGMSALILSSEPYATCNVHCLANAVSNDGRCYVLGVGNGTIPLNSGFSVLAPSQQVYSSFLWETNGSYVTKNLLYHSGLPIGLNDIAVDTTTGSLYIAGAISGNATLGSITASPQSAGVDGLVLKVATNSYLPLSITNSIYNSCQTGLTGIGSSTGATGGRPPYTYSWSNTTGIANPNSPYTQFTYSAPGTYTLTVTDANNDTARSTLQINGPVNIIPRPTITVNGTVPYCNTPITLTCSPGVLYQWSNGATTQSITVTTGSFSVRTMDLSGCVSAYSDTIVITSNGQIPSTPSITNPQSMTVFCPGDSLTLVSSSVQASGYLWSTGDTTQSIRVFNAGSYTVRTLNAFGCASNPSLPFIVDTFTRPPRPVLTIANNNGSSQLCQGQPAILTSSSGFFSHWSTGAVLTGSITVGAPGSFWVQAIEFHSNTPPSPGSACKSFPSDTVTLVLVPPPTTPTITASGPLVFCEGDSVLLTSSFANGGYIWSNGESRQTITVRTSGYYYVNTFEHAGCFSEPSNTLWVVVSSLSATPTITASGPLSFCAGDSVELVSSPANSYLWSNGETTQSIIVTTAGDYSVVTGNGTCTSAASNTLTVEVNTIPDIPVITANGPLSFCAGDSVELVSSPANSYLWSNGATTQSITVSTSGNYSVITNNACFSSSPSTPLTVTVNPTPSTPEISASGSLAICQGSSVQLSSTTANSYLWSNGATTQSITVSTAGDYSVVTSNAAGCRSASSNTLMVTVNPLPATPLITANGPLTFCEGGSVQLTTSAAANNYLWSNGAATQSITVTTAGDYSVVTTSSAGCSSAVSNTLSTVVNQNPPVPVITQSGNTLSSSAATGNQWYFNGTVISGATGQTYNYTAPGEYSVTVTDGHGCSSSSDPYTANFVNGTITVLNNGEEFLHSIAPNPANSQASINYHLQSASEISIQMMAMNGSRTIIVLPATRQPAGYYRMDVGQKLAVLRPGMYVVQYLVNGQTVTDKFVLSR